MKYFAALLLCAIPFTSIAEPEFVSGKTDVGPRNFRQAKNVLPQIYSGREEDFYCGCAYTGKTMDLASCGYQVRKQATRAARLEWEHVVPAWVIGHQKQCWQAKVNGKAGGRKHCTKVDSSFRKAEGDLVNLVPSIGEVNGDRSNYGFSVWQSDAPSMYGQCETAVDFKRRAVQPRPDVRGEIARIQFYMADTYSLNLSRQETRLFCAWAKQHPVSEWEVIRNKRIIALQGQGNPYVSSPAKSGARCG